MQNPSESPFQGDPPPFDKGGIGCDKLFVKVLFIELLQVALEFSELFQKVYKFFLTLCKNWVLYTC